MKLKGSRFKSKENPSQLRINQWNSQAFDLSKSFIGVKKENSQLYG